eukprot:12245833-Karenia_brevis.AAC.1
MNLCLSTGSKYATSKRIKLMIQIGKGKFKYDGPCVACKAICKGTPYCRVQKGHTAASAPRKRKRKLT